MNLPTELSQGNFNMKRFYSNWLTCLAIFGTLAFHASVSAQDADTPKPETVKIFDTLTMTIPGGWKSVPPKSRIVEKEYGLVLDAAEKPKTRVTLMAAGGGVDANIKRWEGQFSGDNEAKVDKFSVGEHTAYLVKLEGTYSETMGGGPFSGGRKVKREDYMMLGGIVEMKDGRQYFIKMIGPEAEVGPQAEAFKKMMKEIE